MRVDIREDPLGIAMRAHAFLDGEEIPMCVMADEEAGLALCYLNHDHEIDFRITSKGAEPILYEVRGPVEIRFDG